MHFLTGLTPNDCSGIVQVVGLGMSDLPNAHLEGTFMENDRRVSCALGVVRGDQPAVPVRAIGWGISSRIRSRIHAMDLRARTHCKPIPTHWITHAISVSDAPAGFGPRNAPKKNRDANPLKDVRAAARSPATWTPNVGPQQPRWIPPPGRARRFDFHPVFRYNSPLQNPRGSDHWTPL